MSVELAERPTGRIGSVKMETAPEDAGFALDEPIISVDDGVLFVVPTAEWNHTSPSAENLDLVEVHHTLEASGVWNVIVDLHRLSYLGSRCLGAIVRLGREIARRGGIMLLCHASHQGQDLLRICRLDLRWFTCDDREEALLLLRRLVVDRPEPC